MQAEFPGHPRHTPAAGLPELAAEMVESLPRPKVRFRWIHDRTSLSGLQFLHKSADSTAQPVADARERPNLVQMCGSQADCMPPDAHWQTKHIKAGSKDLKRRIGKRQTAGKWYRSNPGDTSG